MPNPMKTDYSISDSERVRLNKNLQYRKNKRTFIRDRTRELGKRVVKRIYHYRRHILPTSRGIDVGIDKLHNDCFDTHRRLKFGTWLDPAEQFKHVIGIIATLRQDSVIARAINEERVVVGLTYLKDRYNKRQMKLAHLTIRIYPRPRR